MSFFTRLTQKFDDFHIFEDEEELYLPVKRYVPTDTLFGNQWHLSNSTAGEFDLNITDVWDDYQGNGITIAVIDDGFDYSHSDLAANYDTANDYDYGANDFDAAPVHSDDDHGTAVMGIIGADDNGTGVVGVAHDATLVGYRVDFNASYNSFTTDLYQAITQAKNEDVDVVNMSLGIADFDNYQSLLNFGILTAIEDGRDELGTIMVVAGGNDRFYNLDVNLDSLSNSPYTIAVGAIDQDGSVSSYSTPGASLLVSAFGSPSNITTTDRSGAVGYDSTDWTSSFNGTSAAAPQVSGIAGLMLEANASLTWKDVQDILAYSAKQTGSDMNAGPSGSELHSWTFNGAENWNGGGLHFSEDYGFGRVDAHDAVRLAETWYTLEAGTSSESFSQSNSTNYTIPDLDQVSYTIDITDNFDIDTVVLDMSIIHDYMSDLEIKLVSPEGTETILSDNVGMTGDGFISWEFSSSEFRGESSTGTWTITVTDNINGDAGTITNTRLEIYGTDREAVTGTALTDDFYVYTDEFADYASLSTRNTLTDITGTDILNAAAVTTDSTIDLRDGNTSTIAGQSLTISAGTIIEKAHGGDGDDTIFGNDEDNFLWGHRGDDTLNGGDGADDLQGGAGIDAADYDGASAGVTASLTTGTGTAGDAAGDSYTDIEGFIGSDHVDRFTGDINTNYIFGGAGNDIIRGQGGADELFGDDGDDTIFFDVDDIIVDGGAGYDRVFVDNTSQGVTIADMGASGIEYARGANWHDTFDATNVTEAVKLWGFGRDDILTGSAFNDYLNGGSGNDTVNGNAGNDTVDGHTGADMLSGGAGNDLFYIDADDTLIDGGADYDRIYVRGYSDGVDIDMTSGNLEYANGNLRDDIFDATGSTIAIKQLGQKGNDTLTGGDAADLLYGGLGNDVITGGLGNDYLNGADGIDILTGGAGVDNLKGYSGTDTLNGGAGDDFLYGGTDADIFVFDAGWGLDRLADWEDGADSIDMSSLSIVFGDLAISQVGAHTDIDYGADTIRVLNTVVADFDASDFAFI